MRKIIIDLYKAGSTFGDGGTADAIAYERATGQAVGGRFHILKGQQYSDLSNCILVMKHDGGYSM